MVSSAVLHGSYFGFMCIRSLLRGQANRYAESFGKLEEGLLMELLSIRHVSKSFLDHDSTVHAVTDVSLDIFPGEMIAIIGPS